MILDGEGVDGVGNPSVGVLPESMLMRMIPVAPLDKHIWCCAGPLREEDITHRPDLITGHEGIVQTQNARSMIPLWGHEF